MALTATVDDVQVLAETEWRARAAAHRARVEPWTLPHRERKSRGQSHPVIDFLFTYYSLRPRLLEQWQPGPGVGLRGGEEFLGTAGYVLDHDVVRLDLAAVPDRLRRTAGYVAELLTATAGRPPRLSCFGLHEWAMVYRTAEEGSRPRHDGVPLRLGAAGTDTVVESLPVHCTHFDAYRFFTEAARPLNLLTPTREDQIATEQPGCLHASMDLYKWAAKLLPVTPAELLADCFVLAADVRELDMRASPYDLAAYGYAPVRIETPTGRAAYARAQGEFAERAAPLRERLIELCELAALETDEGD